MNALRFARRLIAVALIGATLVACSQGPQEVVAPALTATSSASSPPAAALPSAPEIVATKAELVRFGAVGLGKNPTFVAFRGDGGLIAASLGMAGAEVELLEPSGAAVGTFKPELEQAVRAIDFSPDGTKLLVSLTGGPRRPAALVELSVPALTPLRTLTLPADPAPSWFERGVEAHYTDSGEIVGVTEGALVVWGTSGEARRTITKLTAGAALGTSPSRRWLVVSTPDGIELREAAHPEKRVAQVKRTGPDKGLPSPRAFVSDDGALLFQDQGHVKLLPKGGTAADLGAGRPLGLGAQQALVGDGRRVRVAERTGAKTVAELQAADAWLSPSGAELLAHTGADAANALSLLPVARLIDKSLVMHGSTQVLAFTADGSGVAVADRGELVIWDRATRAVRSRAPLPGKHDGALGMIRDRDGALLVWLHAPDELVRYDGRAFESLGPSLLAKPSAFVAPGGSIVVVGGEDTATSRGHLVIRDRHASPFLWNALLPLSATQALSTGPSDDKRGDDLGPGPLADRRGAPTKLPTAWLSHVDLWRAAPTGELGGIVLTGEGDERQFVLRHVDASGLSAPCLLGDRRPSYDTPMLTSPDGATVALVLEPREHRSRVLFVDHARCALRAVDVDGVIEGLDYAPDGRSLALGLSDRSFAVLSVPERDASK